MDEDGEDGEGEEEVGLCDEEKLRGVGCGAQRETRLFAGRACSL